MKLKFHGWNVAVASLQSYKRTWMRSNFAIMKDAGAICCSTIAAATLGATINEISTLNRRPQSKVSKNKRFTAIRFW